MPGEVIFQNPYPEGQNNQQNQAVNPAHSNTATIANLSVGGGSFDQDRSSKMDLGSYSNSQNGEIPIYLNQTQNSQGPDNFAQNNNNQVNNYSENSETVGLGVSNVNQKKASSSVISILFLVWICVGVYYFLGGNVNLDFLKGQLGLDLEMSGSASNQNITSTLENPSSKNGIVIQDENLLSDNTTEVVLDDVDKLFLTQENKANSNFPVTKASYNQNDADTDHDNMSDLSEKVLGTDPYKSDTDGDNLSDYQEVVVYKTNPLKVDTDGDGLADLEEILKGRDPLRSGF